MADVDLLYKVPVDRAKSNAFISVLRARFAREGFEPVRAPARVLSLSEFEAHVGATHAHLLSGDRISLLACLDVLCVHFSQPLANLKTYAMLLQLSPLLLHLLDGFGRPELRFAGPLIADLLVNLSAIDRQFAEKFILDGHCDKIIAARGCADDALLLVLAYNIFAQVGSRARPSGEYLSRLSAAVQTGDGTYLFFGPFVLVGLLRSSPVGDPAFHGQFAEVIGQVLRMCSGDPLQIAMWAVYFWLRNNGAVVWDSLTPALVHVLCERLEDEDIAVIRLALFANGYLWLVPGGPSDLLRSLFADSLCRRLCELIAHDRPDVSAYASIAMANAVASDDEVAADAVARSDVVECVCHVLQRGAAQAKVEAARLACTLLWWAGDVEAMARTGIVEGIADAIETDDEDLVLMVVRVLAEVVAAAPEVADILLEVDFEGVLAERRLDFDLGPADEAIVEQLQARRDRR
jgi:hypothetical protein